MVVLNLDRVNPFATIVRERNSQRIARACAGVNVRSRVTVEDVTGRARDARVRRAKLYYLRALTGKKARIKEKRVNN